MAESLYNALLAKRSEPAFRGKGAPGCDIKSVLLPIHGGTDDRDQLLLKLSIIRQLYARQVLLEEDAVSLMNDVTYQLVKLLQNVDRLIVYEAEKASVAVLSNQNCTVKIVKDTLIMLTQQMLRKEERTTEYEMVYSLQLLTELLKAIRKENKTPLTIAKKDCCFMVLSSCWNQLFKKIVSPLLSSPPLPRVDVCKMAATVDQSLLQLLLLMIEILKHSNIETPILHSFQSPLILGDISQAVQSSFSLICYTKLCDLFRKHLLLLDDEGGVGSPLLILDLFMNHYVSSHNVFIDDWFTRQYDQISDTSSIEYSIVDTYIRKSLLISLQLATQDVTDLVHERLLFKPVQRFMQYLREVSLKKGESYINVLLQLISEQDTCLVETLTYSLKLTELQQERGSSELILNIHELFISFLDSITYDESTLIDFIIDTDTRFDSFLNSYLQHSNKNGGNALAQYCTERSKNEESTVQLVDYSDSEDDEQIESTRCEVMLTRLRDKLIKLEKQSVIPAGKLPTVRDIIKNIIL
ncbi:PREDICTED: uncharacterized protein LOC109583108 [Amphimedon queenslandica]|uniref:Protein Lines N-terminal domain-containing protein n=1 Tax=Amphimedon queenslandica TaxID=400682 RepID=A0AAN0J9Y9_AMPQE|nr:PREDICTED: uncharacterized protein LOC109583108 [Amphimedon queenslandica]|eukprot:XP_019853855.1 PREDICTED: uncharacterized protein LOC109583108 [Amphimedon queenslandica]